MSTTAKLGRLFAAAGVAWTVVGGGAYNCIGGRYWVKAAVDR
jgi:hypothetical protein